MTASRRSGRSEPRGLATARRDLRHMVGLPRTGGRELRRVLPWASVGRDAWRGRRLRPTSADPAAPSLRGSAACPGVPRRAPAHVTDQHSRSCVIRSRPNTSSACSWL